jgi:hypothetical protein
MKLIAVTLLYVSFFLVAEISSLHTSTPDNFKNANTMPPETKISTPAVSVGDVTRAHHIK